MAVSSPLFLEWDVLCGDGKRAAEKAADMSGEQLTSEIKDMFSKLASSGDDEKAETIELPRPLCIVPLLAGGGGRFRLSIFVALPLHLGIIYN